MVLRQTFKNHIIFLEFTIIVTLLLLGIWWYFFNFDKEDFIIIALFHGVFTIPALYLHIEYSIRNAGEEIEINHNGIILKKHGYERTLNSNDLLKIIVYKSASLDKKGIPLSAMERYHYVRLIARDGEEIIITCLMSPNVDKEVSKLTGVPNERKKRFFCTLNWK